MTDATLAFLAPARTSVTLEQYILDASAFAGQSVRLRLVDTATGSWGHIAIDNINYSAIAPASADVPEPATGLLALFGVTSLALRRRRAA